jgi:predicted transcriptional regulator
MSISKFYQYYRKKHDISQYELAKRTGDKSSIINRIEVDEYDLPMRPLKRLYRLLDDNEKRQLLSALRRHLKFILEESLKNPGLENGK